MPSNATTPSFPATSMPCKVKGCEKIRPAFDRAYDSITVSRDSPLIFCVSRKGLGSNIQGAGSHDRVCHARRI